MQKPEYFLHFITSNEKSSPDFIRPDNIPSAYDFILSVVHGILNMIVVLKL